MITRTGYTGEDGFEIIVHDAASGAMAVWEDLMKGATPCALGARDSLRLEAGLPLYGSDMDEGTNPLEGRFGLGDLQGQEILCGMAEAGVIDAASGLPARIRRGIITGREDSTPETSRSPDKDGEEIGVVTSGTFSPVLKRGIAMGYIKTPPPQLGETLEVVVRDTPSDKWKGIREASHSMTTRCTGGSENLTSNSK